MAITEAKIILPAQDNQGNPMTNQIMIIEAMLLGFFGGFTYHESVGMWRDPKTNLVYSDRGRTYVIASDWSRSHLAEHLHTIAADAAVRMDQECVYICINGEVTFVEPHKEAVAA